jgi:hypothetical protein
MMNYVRKKSDTLFFLVITLSVFSFLACSDDSPGDGAGGAIGETTNGIAGIIVTEAGPVAGARVVVHSGIDGSRDYELEADEKGEFFLDHSVSLNSTRFHLEVMSDDSADMAWIWNIPRYLDDTTLQIELKPSAALSGDVSGSGAEAAEGKDICLSGSSYCSEIKNGNYAMAKVPAQNWTLEKRDLAQELLASVSLAAGEENIADIEIIEPEVNLSDEESKELLFEDFNDGDHAHLLRSVTGETWWYMTSLGGLYWNWPAVRDDIPGPVDFMVTEGAYEGRSLIASYTDEGGSALIGIHLREDGEPVDLSGLKEVKVWMKGDGLVQLAIEEGIAENQYRKTLFEASLSDEWQEYVFTIGEELVVEGYAQALPFSELQDKIRVLTFFVQQGSYVGIDQIRFTGIDLSVFED